MSLLALFSAGLIAIGSGVPTDTIPSGVWHWDDLSAERTDWGGRRVIFAGEAFDLTRISMSAVTLNPGGSAEMLHSHEAEEEMVVVKEGLLSVTIRGETKVLGPGSVVVALARDPHRWHNAGDEPVTFYTLLLESRAGVNADRAATTGPSMVIDQRDVAFSANPRGGSRSFFDRSTATLQLFELHETTLVGGVQNHPVHTHRAEEMVIMLEGHVEMEIGGRLYEGRPGDVYFIASDDPHTLFTKGETPSRYLAFQWR